MRILVTGGHGFLGGRIGEFLYQAGHQIVLGSRDNVDSPLWLPASVTAQTEWNDEVSLERICNGVDVVIHAAGMNAQDCVSNPTSAFEFNGLATARLFEAARRAGVKRFIYFSTAHVYASPLAGVITEETSLNNQHPYATSHVAGECAVLRTGGSGEIDGVVLRLSNAFGAPTEKEVNCWSLLVNDLCMRAVQNKQMVLRSSGMQQRDFIALAEVARVVEHLSVCNLDTQAPRIFNLGSGVSKTVYEMALQVQERCKKALGFEPKLMRPVTCEDEVHESLHFRLENLAKMGIRIKQDNNAELDELLIFCQRTFGNNKE